MIRLVEPFKFLGFTSATYRWSEHARRYGLDRLVPPKMKFDLRELGLHGGPTGTFTLQVAWGAETG